MFLLVWLWYIWSYSQVWEIPPNVTSWYGNIWYDLGSILVESLSYIMMIIALFLIPSLFSLLFKYDLSNHILKQEIGLSFWTNLKLVFLLVWLWYIWSYSLKCERFLQMWPVGMVTYDMILVQFWWSLCPIMMIIALFLIPSLFSLLFKYDHSSSIYRHLVEHQFCSYNPLLGH